MATAAQRPASYSCSYVSPQPHREMIPFLLYHSFEHPPPPQNEIPTKAREVPLLRIESYTCGLCHPFRPPLHPHSLMNIYRFLCRGRGKKKALFFVEKEVMSEGSPFKGPAGRERAFCRWSSSRPQSPAQRSFHVGGGPPGRRMKERGNGFSFKQPPSLPLDQRQRLSQ